jgi:Cdc6-like AAA superfamily ATPase
LAGREESLQHITKCFLTSYQERCNKDRNSRPIPVCTGIPGLGKTRLMEECAATVFDRTQIPGHRVSGIISFGNDGNLYGQFDELLGIQCSFSWRVLHMFFKAHYSFEDWMHIKSPTNRSKLTLRLALSVVERYWSQKTKENILVLVGIDEFQKLDQEKLNSLLDILCDCLCRSAVSKLSFFSMLAGTDLNMTRIARASHPNTQRIPIRFLTHKNL